MINLQSTLEAHMGNVTDVISRAMKEPSLQDALALVCLWECERVVKEAHEFLSGRKAPGPDDQGWDTCFKFFISETIKAWEKKICSL